MSEYKELMPICGFTPPPNGNVRIGNHSKYIEDFRTYERYKEYKDCGFSEILFAGEDKYQGEYFETSQLKMMMDLAWKVGLKAIVYDERIISLMLKSKNGIVGESFSSQSELNNYIAECMKDYSLHPSFYGISVVDEPRVSMCNIVSEMTQAIKSYSSKIFVHTCFLPCIQDLGLVPGAFGEGFSSVWSAYKNYIEKTSKTGLGYFGYDAYPFGFWNGKNVVTAKFIRNMQVASVESYINGVPFHMTIQSFSSGINDELRLCDEADLNWQANLALGFACKKIYYFTYWRFTTRPSAELFKTAIIDEDGSKIIYDEVQRNNALIQRTFNIIYDCKYIASQVFGDGKNNECTAELETKDLGFVSECNSDSQILINKLVDNAGKSFFMLLNLRDPYEKFVNRVKLKMIAQKPEYLILKRGREMKLLCDNGEIIINLEAGEAVWFI